MSKPSILYPAFEAAIQEYRDLTGVEQRSDTQEAERMALADAIRSICRSETNLRQIVPRAEADEIMKLAEARDSAHQAEVNEDADSKEAASDAYASTDRNSAFRRHSVGGRSYRAKDEPEWAKHLNKLEGERWRARMEKAEQSQKAASSTKAFTAAAAAFATLPNGAPERAEAADALRSMARVPDTLTQNLGKEQAEEVMEVARQRDEQQAAKLGMEAVGDVPQRTTWQNADAWRDVMDAHPKIVKSVAEYGSHVDVHLTDGSTVRDTGDKLTAEAITPKVAEAMALGAVEKGWEEVRLTGSKEEKETMAKAMVARGVTVLNPEMQRFINGPECERARALGAEREVLALARQQPDLADPKLFQQAERDYQRALIGGNTPDDQLMAMKADVMARGEAIKDAGYSGGEAWAQQAEHVDTVPAVAEYTARA